MFLWNWNKICYFNLKGVKKSTFNCTYVKSVLYELLVHWHDTKMSKGKLIDNWTVLHLIVMWLINIWSNLHNDLTSLNRLAYII